MSNDKADERFRRRIRMLWIGFVLYLAIMFNGLRYARLLPYQLFAIGSAVNILIIVAFVVAIRNAYKKQRTGNP